MGQGDQLRMNLKKKKGIWAFFLRKCDETPGSLYFLNLEQGPQKRFRQIRTEKLTFTGCSLCARPRAQRQGLATASPPRSSTMTEVLE